MSKTYSADEIIIGAIANDVRLKQGTVDPSAGGGVAAAIGSKFFRGPATGGDYTKTGVADTAWTLTPADIYFNVANYGAAGDGVTDDRAAIQAAIDDAAVFGGCVFFPYASGVYLVGFDGANVPSFDLTGVSNVRFLGGGPGVTLRISGDAAGTARSLFRAATSSSIEFELLTFSQSALTNPLAGQCHVVELLAGADITKFINCRWEGGVAGAGSYLYLAGTGAGDVTSVWVSEGCQMADAGAAAIRIDGYVQRVWIEDGLFSQSGAITDTILISETNGGGIADVKLFGNEVSNATGYAVRATCASGQLIERLQVSDGNLILGFVSIGFCDRGQIIANEIMADVAGVADAVVTLDGTTTHVQVQANLIARGSTCNAGLVFEVSSTSAAAVTTRCQVQHNTWVQETQAGLVSVTNASDIQLHGNQTHTDNAGATVNSAYVFDAADTTMTGIQIADEISALVGTWAIGIEFLTSASGDIGQNQIVGAQITDCDVGVSYDSSAGGSFSSSQTMLASSNIEAATAAWTSTAALYPRVGGNAGTFGVNIIEGSGTPEANVQARIGSVYSRTDGGAGTTFYVKESGTGTAGWVGK